MTDFEKQTYRIWKSLKAMDPRPAMTLDEFREMVDHRQWRRSLLWRCMFCRELIAITELSFDHLNPRSQGGETAPGNLGECCRKCNRIKGAIDQKHFYDLCNLVRTWTPAERKDVMRRLGQKPSFRFGKKKEPKQKSWEGVAARNQQRYGNAL